MTRRSRTEAMRLLEQLRAEPAARLVECGSGMYELAAAGGRKPVRLDAEAIRLLVASGLLQESEPGHLAATGAAGAWLKRQQGSDLAFRVQHHDIEPATVDGGTVLRNMQESPVAALARASAGRPAWLAPHAVAAAERLRCDFEMGQLQPRITANWSASVATGRRSGESRGLRDLTDMALAARLRFDRAMQAAGPEFSGILADVCCFLKGLETVERERQWPARSAKLVLRLALDSLARHYGLAPEAAGKAAAGLRHWGAEDYRPQIT